MQLSEEELQRKVQSTLNEYVNTLLEKEALECIRELQAPVSEGMPAYHGFEVAAMPCGRDRLCPTLSCHVELLQ